ncbi:ABC transporter ATP-binding protein [Desulfosarcina ovata]|uniref:Iron ABC transporter ATP-binding protein n=1 Tax=Desulfosarcina ovata subsp. ovata TaxID=2752305 RepID=A0A5K8ALG1_9BACT|nr:ABC transporter ATP-binding protein [Desulfosarcina ovata]BBO93389.1 iron ABC transporter ATP-binding protein [Desulfosarcina ovata subsp. ovata]
MMSLITVNHVTYGYDHRPVLRDVSLSFAQGEVISLLGPNGSGKTTLLKLLMGLLSPREGEILLESRPVASIPPRKLARRIAYVPQIHQASFGYRVLDVVLMGRMPHKPFFFRYDKADEAMAHQALERLSIGHLKDRSCTAVSGGERQLVLIARALVQGADIFVMDEPVNGLDYGNQIRLLGRIADLARDGYTFIKTTHFPDHALWISDRVVMLKQGQVIADGRTRDVISRNNLFRLYNTPVNVIGLAGGYRICVPEALNRFKRPAPASDTAVVGLTRVAG